MSQKRLQAIAPFVSIALLLLLLYFLVRRGNEETPQKIDKGQTGQGRTTDENKREEWRKLTLKEKGNLSATIRGTVTCVDNGALLYGIAVSCEVSYVEDARSKAATRSRLDGTYELNPLLGQSLETFQVSAVSKRWLTQRREVDIRIGETLENVNFILTDTTDITITLIDADDNSPVTRAEVTLREPKSKAIYKLDSEMPPGDYYFKNIRKNYYQFTAQAEGYVELMTGVRVVEENQKFRFRLGQCSTLSGRVTDPNGFPIAGAYVFFRMAGGMITRTITDEYGDYIFNRLKPCQGEIGAEHPDYAKRVDAVIEIEKGENATHDIVLAKGVAVFGTVEDLNGTPLVNAEVRMIMEFFHTGMTHIGKTDKEGKYRFENVAPAKYTFQIQATGYITKFEQHFQVEVDAGDQQKDFALDPGGRILGRVQDSSGEPIAGVSISAESGFGFPAKTKSDENGDFEIGGLALDQEYNVIFTPRNNAYRKMPGVSPNTDLGVVTLESYGSLKGTVVWGNTPLPVVRVVVWRLEDPSFKNAMFTDENGIFFKKELRPGIYHLEVNAAGFRKHAIDNLDIKENTAVEDMIINLTPSKPR
ncbi:MAG: carboxypeptidase regulatory-like domain-containing protein [Planctomycetota bacterium]|nr:MAG: carboxypeptidase regulatory-like domain-containing protein [Planctomycetota bacterium]